MGRSSGGIAVPALDTNAERQQVHIAKNESMGLREPKRPDIAANRPAPAHLWVSERSLRARVRPGLTLLAARPVKIYQPAAIQQRPEIVATSHVSAWILCLLASWDRN